MSLFFKINLFVYIVENRFNNVGSRNGILIWLGGYCCDLILKYCLQQYVVG